MIGQISDFVWTCAYYLTINDLFDSSSRLKYIMARGQQKIESQQKAAEKAAKLKKIGGQSAAKNKEIAAKGLKWSCVVCKSTMPDPKTYKQHFENKHPKSPLPEELKDI